MDKNLKKRTIAQTSSNSTLDIEEEDDDKKTLKGKVRKGPTLTYDQLRDMSRKFHRSIPPNPFFRQKIPYKTIIICILFLIGGIIFLSQAAIKTVEEGIYHSYEFILLGLILFIPGVYHTFLAFMACRRVPGYSFLDVCVFDEHIHNEDD